MRVMYDLPPEIVSAVEGRSALLGITADEYVAEHLRQFIEYPSVRVRVGALVRAGKSDAQIAGIMHYSPGRVAEIRRSLGLPPNRRYGGPSHAD